MSHASPSLERSARAAPLSLEADRALVKRVLAGEAKAERELYQQHVMHIYRFIFRLTGRAEAAQDWTQDTFIRAFDRLAQFRGEASLATWLRAIALSVTRNRMETVLRREAHAAPLDEAADVAATEISVDPDLRDQLDAAISALPAGTRAVYVLHDLEGFTHEEIAEQLGIVEGTSKSQLSKARARLRAALAPFRSTECA